MTQSKPRPAHSPLRLVVSAGLTIGLVIMGDSLLYNLLPLEAARLGISLPLVGVLLSANRIVRLVSNAWMSAVFERFGPRLPFIGAAALGLATTLVYGAGWGAAAFLAARLGWGVAWSALRQGGYQAVWTDTCDVKGRYMGLVWGIVRMGSAISVVAGGFLRDRFGYSVAVWAVACAGVLGIPVALSMRWPASQRATRAPNGALTSGWSEAFRDRRRRLILAAGLADSLFEGIIVSTASLFLAGVLGSVNGALDVGIGLGTLGGMLLAVRWTSDLIFGPAFGALSDRLGQPRTAVLLSCALLAATSGAAAARGLAAALCLALMFIIGAGLNIVLGTLANGLALRAERPHLFVGVYTTAADAGLALGPIAAYAVGGTSRLPALYVAIVLLITLAVIAYRRAGR
ncbi:MAG: MFS transporter [Chloroflexi bacterium]|nr:MFS transporter [Chloroflexota bacterium]